MTCSYCEKRAKFQGKDRAFLERLFCEDHVDRGLFGAVYRLGLPAPTLGPVTPKGY